MLVTGAVTTAVYGLVLVLAGVLWLTRLDGGSAYLPDVLPSLVVALLFWYGPDARKAGL